MSSYFSEHPVYILSKRILTNHNNKVAFFFIPKQATSLLRSAPLPTGASSARASSRWPPRSKPRAAGRGRRPQTTPGSTEDETSGLFFGGGKKKVVFLVWWLNVGISSFFCHKKTWRKTPKKQTHGLYVHKTTLAQTTQKTWLNHWLNTWLNTPYQPTPWALSKVLHNTTKQSEQKA